MAFTDFQSLIWNYSCEVNQGIKVLQHISKFVDAASAKNPKFRDEYLANVKICKE